MNRPASGDRRKPGPSWATYRQTIGDRSELFGILADGWPSHSALYPGCYLDVSPSTAIPAVTYVDTDRRAERYFADHERVAAELRSRVRQGLKPRVRFLRGDYTTALDCADAEFDLLISLYSGPLWDHCRKYLQPGGLFLANASHGDASIAALDPRLTLLAAVHKHNDRYRFDTDALDSYLVPKSPAAADPDEIRRNGRGIAYTRTAFAYLFRLI
ncbi:MAG: class I SAM-dependent methyltransferase [Mycobacterium sp.]|nr:class I SAM-dependent methyltransferase [Mycobacterium sp.]